MASRTIYLVVAAAGIAAASGAAWWYQKPKNAANADASQVAQGKNPAGVPVQGTAGAAGAKPTVEVANVQLARLTDDTQTVGSLRSRRSVILRPEVSGRVTQLNFTDGQRVRKGQVLVQLDDQLPLAQVQQSQAELSIAMANQKRNQELVAQNFISQRSLDESAANLQVAQAKLSLAKATAARLKIVAPFDGIAGIRLVNVGDYLKDGADIVNIEDIDAVFVDFRLPERFQSKVQRGQVAVLDIDALPGRQYQAQIQAIDPLIDANGRSVGLRGCVDNRQLQLRPGMFARVNTVFGVRDNARVIPEEAIVPQGARQYVLKVVDGTEAGSRVTRRTEVKVGLRIPGRVEVLEGLEAGDTVVVAGQQKIQRDGSPVTVIQPQVPGNGVAPPEVASAGSAKGAGVSPATASAAQPSLAASAPAALPAATTGATVPAVKVAAPSAAAAVPTGPSPCGAAIAGTAPVPMPRAPRAGVPDGEVRAPAAALRTPA